MDTETTGLLPYKGDRLFSIIIADSNETYYFNFQKYEPTDIPKLTAWLQEKGATTELISYDNELHCLPREWLKDFEPVFAVKESYWFLQNAKFDMGMLYQDGLEISGTIHDTETIARVLNNSYFKYNLSELLKRMNQDVGKKGPEKIDLTAKYVKEFGLFDKIQVPGKEKIEELWHAEKVPPEIMIPYGAMDGYGTRELGCYQNVKLAKFPKRNNLVAMEKKLTKALFKIETAGFKINPSYTQEKLQKELVNLEKAKREFSAICGQELIDSATHLSPIFESFGYVSPKTEKGNDSLPASFLEEISHPLATALLNFRDARKKAGTYYSSFLYYSDKENRVHANFRQGGTTTGRLSCMDPNLQNVPKPDDDGDDPAATELSKEVRRCFIPSDENYCLVSIDWDQMEYRLMLEEAEEMELIEKVLSGTDVHTGTAEMMSSASRAVKRKHAKTINFMLLYGGGVAKLAKALGISLEEARELKALYFSRLNKIKEFIYLTQKKIQLSNVIQTGEGMSRKGYVENWFGRVSYLDKNYAYKGVNYKIQGGCADVAKLAICEIQDFIEREKLKTKLVSTVHDEMIFESHRSELHYVEEFKRIMETVYKPKYLPLTCGVSHSWVSWGDMCDGMPVASGP